MQIDSEILSHGGTQYVCTHPSRATGTPMTFSIFVPDSTASSLPVVWYLSGLTCTHANVTDKGEFRRACAELGLIFVAPDTSPRGEGVADDPEGAYDFGLGAGFYVDATEPPFAEHYRMWSYITDELPGLIAERFPCDMGRQSIMGHSMGGHGALTIGLSFPERYKAISAFAPIVGPSAVPWGQKALRGYLGTEQKNWRQHDAVLLVEDLVTTDLQVPQILIDQGAADSFLEEQLQPHRFVAVCEQAGVNLELRMQPGYDHSYYFISTFMAEHLGWHADLLRS
ncbi:MAG: S-formylglutathione hydrolase [Pseudomonadota bacterium]